MRLQALELESAKTIELTNVRVTIERLAERGVIALPAMQEKAKRLEADIWALREIQAGTTEYAARSP